MNINPPIRVSVSEASRLFGVDQKTIRRAIKNQEIKYIVVTGRYRLHFESLLEWSQGRTAVRNKLASAGIGQYVDKWRIKNKLYSPNPKLAEPIIKEVPESTTKENEIDPLTP